MSPVVPPRPALVPVGGSRFQLQTPCTYDSPRLGRLIVVPSGFITDFESIPRWLPIAYALLKDTAPLAGLLHDYLYASQTTSQADADAVLVEAAVAEGAPRWKAWAMWLGLKIGGHLAYDHYTRLTAAGSRE